VETWGGEGVGVHQDTAPHLIAAEVEEGVWSTPMAVRRTRAADARRPTAATMVGIADVEAAVDHPRPVVALPRLVVAVALPRLVVVVALPPLVVVALTEVAATTLGQRRGLSILLARRTPGGTPGPIAHTLRSPSRVPRKLVTPGESKSKARWWTMNRARRGRGRIHQ